MTEEYFYRHIYLWPLIWMVQTSLTHYFINIKYNLQFFTLAEHKLSKFSFAECSVFSSALIYQRKQIHESSFAGNRCLFYVANKLDATAKLHYTIFFPHKVSSTKFWCHKMKEQEVFQLSKETVFLKKSIWIKNHAAAKTTQKLQSAFSQLFFLHYWSLTSDYNAYFGTWSQKFCKMPFVILTT